MFIIRIILILFLASVVCAQGSLSGTVTEIDENGNSKPLVGANVIWQGTTIGTSTDNEGNFEIKRTSKTDLLIVSYIGYISDTLKISNQQNIDLTLRTSSKQLDDIAIVERQYKSYSDYFSEENKLVITESELQKAACCTLAESFETNPSIDVSFTDAITGVRQIEMLGLRGIYTQTTMESLPYIRGLMSNTGLTFVPGTWIDAINVSKGIGSVANGFESITGQIDIGLRKPFDLAEPKGGLLNLYANNDQRFEGNLNYRTNLGEDIYSVTLLHGSTRKYKFDANNDTFMDMPTAETVNLMQRFQYLSDNGWSSQLGFQFVNDEKIGGTINSNNNRQSNYNYSSSDRLFSMFAKTGYVFPDELGKSIGIQLSYGDYRNTSSYGINDYEGNEKSLFLNLLYQTSFINEYHTVKTGVSYLYDEFDELYINQSFDRIERVPGAFFEYTYKQTEEFSAVLGLRYDNHNYFGSQFTPRVHLRYSPDSDWIFRGTAGRGFRSSNIFTEYSSKLASSRNLIINRVNNFGYGLNKESAWNYGLNITHYFMYNYNDATLTLDFYRTTFESVNIANLDSNPRQIIFQSIDNGAYSNSFQAELNFVPIDLLETRLAYRFIDVQQKIGSQWIQKPLVAKHRALINFGYSTEKENEDDSQMLYDLTVQWFGPKRIPSTASNPSEFQLQNESPDFVIVNAQVTRSFDSLFDLYIGVENLLDFRQDNPIIDSENPYGNYFDASLIWGPINGRMVYTGLRWKI